LIVERIRPAQAMHKQGFNLEKSLGQRQEPSAFLCSSVKDGCQSFEEREQAYLYFSHGGYKHNILTCENARLVVSEPASCPPLTI